MTDKQGTDAFDKWFDIKRKPEDYFWECWQAAQSEMQEELDRQDNGWTCFHCGEHFITQTHAKLHFGTPHSTAQPACQIKTGAEQGLVKYIRELETRLAKYQEEDSEVMRDAALQRCEKANAVANAEDLGYERGLAAMQKMKLLHYGTCVLNIK